MFRKYIYMLIFVYFILVKFRTLKYFIENKNFKKLSHKN